MLLFAVVMMAAAPDAEAIRGDWRMVEFHAGSGATLAAPGSGPDIGFADGRLRLQGDPAGRYTIDPVRKAIDMAYTIGADAGKQDLGIYRLEGDKLTICTQEAPGPRPDDFTAPKGSRRMLMVYVRMQMRE